MHLAFFLWEYPIIPRATSLLSILILNVGILSILLCIGPIVNANIAFTTQCIWTGIKKGTDKEGYDDLCIVKTRK